MSFQEPERLELLEALSECAQNKAALKATIEEQQAEITRLETINSSRTFLYLEARSLITELCDALEAHVDFEFVDEVEPLIQRAREATQ